MTSTIENMTATYFAASGADRTQKSIRNVIAELRTHCTFLPKMSDQDAEQVARNIEEKMGFHMGYAA